HQDRSGQHAGDSIVAGAAENPRGASAPKEYLPAFAARDGAVGKICRCRDTCLAETGRVDYLLLAAAAQISGGVDHWIDGQRFRSVIAAQVKTSLITRKHSKPAV